MNNTKHKLHWLLSIFDFFHLIPLANRVSRSFYYIAHFKHQKRNKDFRKKGAPDGLPVPSLNLVYSTTAYYDLDKYLKGGLADYKSINQILENSGFEISSFSNILDFGCGCGRIIRHLKSLKNTDVYGVDINKRCILWCDKNLKFAKFKKNSIAPSLDFNDETFDFIYAVSVFTHLNEDLQISWMKEFKRILKKNGLLLLTLHTSLGNYHIVSNEEKKKFLSGELLIQYEKYVGTNFCNVFHPKSYIKNKLSKGFTILDIANSGDKGFRQDIILLKKN